MEINEGSSLKMVSSEGEVKMKMKVNYSVFTANSRNEGKII